MPFTLLFDVDGTITESRQKITDKMQQALLHAANNHVIGLISGSPINYYEEQGLLSLQHKNIILLPCNATQEWHYDTAWKRIRHESMQQLVDTESLITHLEILLNTDLFKTIKPTGKRIEQRDSMINLCPIGRLASLQDRTKFVQQDNKHELRKKWLPLITQVANQHECEVVLGGQTSFDIYPKNWNKTYVLKYLRPDLYIGNSFLADQNDYCMLSQVPCLAIHNPNQALTFLKYLNNHEA